MYIVSIDMTKKSDGVTKQSRTLEIREAADPASAKKQALVEIEQDYGKAWTKFKVYSCQKDK